MGIPPKVYIETSIISYLSARPSRDVITHAHQMITVEWWHQALPRVEAYVSPFVLAEAGRGDPEAAARCLKLVERLPILPSTEAVEELARVYVKERLVPAAEFLDALHLALASYHGLDYLLTWNCRHIAAAEVRRRIAFINRQEGVGFPILCTPEGLMEI